MLFFMKVATIEKYLLALVAKVMYLRKATNLFFDLLF